MHSISDLFLQLIPASGTKGELFGRFILKKERRAGMKLNFRLRCGFITMSFCMVRGSGAQKNSRFLQESDRRPLKKIDEIQDKFRLRCISLHKIACGDNAGKVLLFYEGKPSDMV